MARKRFDALVQRLTSAGYQSPYLERLRRRLGPEQVTEDLRTEIVRETAAALERSADKVDVALLRLEPHRLESRLSRRASPPGCLRMRRRFGRFAGNRPGTHVASGSS